MEEILEFRHAPHLMTAAVRETFVQMTRIAQGMEEALASAQVGGIEGDPRRRGVTTNLTS